MAISIEASSIEKQTTLTILDFAFVISRIKLLISIMEAKQSESPPGAGLNLDDLLNKGAVLAIFPIHNYGSLKRLQKQWLKLWSPPWKQPIGTDDAQLSFMFNLFLHMFRSFLKIFTAIDWLACSQPADEIKDYFGERIGLYFAYLQYYVQSLMLPAAFGVIAFVGECIVIAVVIIIVIHVVQLAPAALGTMRLFLLSPPAYNKMYDTLK
jgi:Calcium-activated chloride channel